MRTINTQQGKYAKIDNVNFAGFDNFEQLAYFHRGLSIVLRDFIEKALAECGYGDRTVCDIAFAIQGHKNTTHHIFSLLVGHIHSLEDELGWMRDMEIDTIIDGIEEGGDE